MRAFVVADNHDELNMFKVILNQAGLEVVASTNLERVLENWWENWGNVIILAVDDNALIFDHTKRIRAVTQVPLFMIVERLSEADYCTLLEEGADLIFSRPISARVLASYTKVFLRRTEAVPSFILSTLEMNGVKLDPATRTTTVLGETARRLTQLEFNLLYTLMTNPDQVIPTDVIVERVWGYDGRGDRELVRGLISRLRQKLEPGVRHSRFIQNVPGVGYRFSVEADV